LIPAYLHHQPDIFRSGPATKHKVPNKGEEVNGEQDRIGALLINLTTA
jgi:hypothetical protein